MGCLSGFPTTIIDSTNTLYMLDSDTIPLEDCDPNSPCFFLLHRHRSASRRKASPRTGFLILAGGGLIGISSASASASESERRRRPGMGFCNVTARDHHPLGVPACDLVVDPALPPPQMHSKVRDVCRTLMSEWSQFSDDELCVTQVSGGITNQLLKVSIVKSTDSPEDSVTVRIFGPNTDAVIDRKRELQAIRVLSDAGFGATLHGVFQNGMVQSFIDAETLSPCDMSKPEMVALIAKELRGLHKVDIPGSKDPQLWKELLNLLDKATDLSFDDNMKQKKYAMISLQKLREEIQVLQGISNSLKAPVVFSHNDLLSGNLMYDRSEEKLYLIDFEYSSYNFRGYDIGNHFAEYAGFECDYSLYPEKKAQYHFFRHYLNPDNPNKVTDAELEELYVESNFYSLASHLYWAIWAIVQAKFSPINFNYLDYYCQRFKEYENRRDEFISLAVKHLDKRKR